MKFKFTNLRLLLKFFKYISPYKKLWFWLVVLSNIGIILSLINPYLAKFIIDVGLVKKDFKSFAILTLLGCVIYLAADLANRIKDYFYRNIRIKANYELNKSVFIRLQSFSLGWFKDKTSAEHIYKLNYDIDNIAEFITIRVPAIFFVLFRLLLILVIVIHLNWKMTLISFLISPFLFLPSRYFGRKMRLIIEDLIRSSENIYRYLEETFSHIQLIKVFGRETASIRSYLEKLISYAGISLKSLKLETVSGFLVEMLSKAAVGIITFYGGYQVIKGRMSLGSLTAIMVYFGQLVGLENELARFFQSALTGLISCERIDKILNDDQDTSARSNTSKPIFKKGEIIFRNVSFGYCPGRSILKNLSFTLPGASRIAIAGRSGCGKTTILSLILGLYDLWEGDIFIDGHNIREIDPGTLKSQVGFALQEPFLWNDSIANNIKYGLDQAGTEEMTEAARLCGVDDLASNLTAGFDTVIGENACRISEGQKQKIAMARAAIKKPKIMILDEAFAAMDSLSEERIISNLKQAQPDMTLIVVSHRLSTVMGMDAVYYLSGPGAIIIDKPQILIKQDPGFRDLFGTQ
ncbi:MAG: ABC transporter ATP-binding protein [Candidatus Omnitrophota bacterium]|nr:ABC transporter ATP-binding protein/permease [Candidatus Omnitrophota bacterium]MBU1928466.1 ABC transporter ATP-binding protein/permease [Candidatus Omnitrophota bacterium]MBU2035461.1 ABC transporter ATP-binding protein/permease [Candidatus Omnitrophota bacterium]MBU2221236.1 ABC transporter ATP-binding protein/permease [Candidatus Omnitrophota bacterium]